MTSLKLYQVGSRLFKIRKSNLKINSFYLSTRTNDLNLIKLESHLKIYGTISKNAFFNILNSIQSINQCDIKLASTLIKSCNLNFVDLFPFQRQSLLNYLFNDLLPMKNVKYTQQDYEIYLANTLSNRSNFDPFMFSNAINKKNILANSKIYSLFIKQLCELNDIKVALLLLNNLIQKSENESFNLENYKSETNCKTENDLFDTLMNNLSTIENNLQEASLFNPIISYYFTKSGDLIKAIELFKLIFKSNLKPNSQTYSSLINGYLYLSKYDECEKLLNKVKNDLTLDDLLSLHTNILHKLKLDLENKDALNSLKESILDTMPKDFNQQERLVFVDNLFHLCSNNRHEDAFNLMQKFFSYEYSLIDPIILDNNDFKLNIADYFCKSIIEFSPDFNTIKKYSSILDKETNKFSNLKKMIYYSLHKTDYYLIMTLIDDLNSNGGGPIKFNYFMPLIANAAKELEAYLSTNQSLLTDPKFKITSLNQFKTIISVVDKMINKYKVYLGLDEIATLVKIYKFEQNELKKYIRFSDLIYLKKLSPLNLFYSSMYTLLNYRLSNSEKLLDSNSVVSDLQDIYELISLTNVSSLEKDLLRRINRYIELVIDKNFVDLEDKDILFKTIKAIVDKCDQNNLTLLSTGMKKLKYRLVTQNENEKHQELENYFDDISNKMNKISENKLDNTNSNKDYVKESISMLQNLIKELKSKHKDHIPATRRLIIALCNKSYVEGVEKPVDRVEDLLKELSTDDLTALVCQELAYLYSTRTLKIDKAKYYFNLMIEKLDMIPHEPNKFKLISYLDVLVNNKTQTKDIKEIFDKLSWSNESNDRVELKNNIKSFLIKLYPNSNPKEYKDLIETMFYSKFIKHSVTYADLVMLKLIEFKMYDDVLNYFKLYLTEHKLSLLEIFVLRLFLSKNGNMLTNKDKDLNELTKLFGKFYDETISFNSLFIAFILNGSFRMAKTIYENNLNKKIELKVLNRCVSQLSSNELLYKKYSKLLKNNMLKFEPIRENGDEIKTIIKKLDNVKF